ncbi:hypothetical protein HK097_009670 [Rhizophlyctis rosea]|uniref:phosphoserine transaminase n=1 Tax=Rhizophlyctis rosea TaxID=64517 RepID=A0AAD5X880_9FUNG|nr:hypothetical protein HK097_009670 [Rhizophlyctis rosea]
MSQDQKTWNFSAGPAVIPRPVLERAQRELLNWNNCGCSVMELSHRSPEFESILSKAEQDFRQILSIPKNYKVLWMQGGATAQFSAVVYNLLGSFDKTADYIVTGAWTSKAVEEAQRLGARVNVVANTKSTGHNGALPPISSWEFTPPSESAYIYYTSNETVHGVEFPDDEAFFSSLPAGVPVICDMSSNIMSRKIDITKYACIFAGAQKNIGPAGVTVLIIREDLIGTRVNPSLTIPIMLDYKICAENNSMYNTPPTYSIYIAGLVFEWLQSIGGLAAIEALNLRKSSKLYDTVAKSDGFYRCPVKEGYRSRMNIPFRIYGKDGQASKELEGKFLKEAEGRGMVQLKGHRSVGGIRASLYNAMPEEGVDALTGFMEEFRRANV